MASGARHTQRRQRPALVVALLGASALALGVVVALVIAPGERTVDSASPPQRAVAAPATTPAAGGRPAVDAHAARAAVASQASGAVAIADILAAQADPTMAGTEVLVGGLEAADPVVVAEAANGLIARGAVSSLPALVAYDVLGRPAAAPAVIDALGRLGALADRDQRGQVLDRLLALLRAEKQRAAAESQGNLIAIYEALGHTGDPGAVAPLERELVDPTVGVAPKVVVVEALVALRAYGSRGVLEQVRDQLATSADGVGFEAELRRDLLAAIRDALVQLS